MQNELINMRRLQESVASDEGALMLSALKNYMVELAGQPASNPEWIKGVGMGIAYLCETKQRLDRLKESLTQ